MEKFTIMTAIAYTSGTPHIGNVYEIILADAIARYKRNRGYDVYFQTGTDEHGLKIQENAILAGKDPKTFTDEVAQEIKDIFAMMNIEYDYFVRTTDDYHVEQVQKIFKKLYDQGDIYKDDYEGWYCTPCESFWTESQLDDDGNCPDCHRLVDKTKEETYFFRLSKYQEQLEAYYRDHPDFIVPESRKNEMINNFIKPGLQDLSVSRTAFDWGIKVPFDQEHVIYVWIDALSNYLTGIGYDVDGNHGEEFADRWPADLQLIGKDIVRFHTIYWPILLMALDLPLPKTIFGHPWLLVEGGKMSKSKGNVVYAQDLVKYFGTDAVRYFVLSEIPYGQDGVLSYELMVEKINSELVNTYGNLVNRTISMVNQYFDGVVTKPKKYEKIEEDLLLTINDAIRESEKAFDQYHMADGIKAIMKSLRRSNKYIDENEPWVLAKDESKKERLNDVLYNLLDSIRIHSIMLSPFIPEASEKHLDYIGAESRDYNSMWCFGHQDEYRVAKEAPILFQRINEQDLMKQIEEDEAQKELESQISMKEDISFEEFMNLDIRVGEVLLSEQHPDADRLLVSQVDVGTGVIQVVSGIKDLIEPEDLVGKKVLVLVNLKPANLRGVESQGMILVAKNDQEMELLSSKVAVGSVVE